MELRGKLEEQYLKYWLDYKDNIMALPKLQTPTYQLVLPSTNEKINYRPFLVREQKILLMAQDAKDDGDIANAVGELVKSCTFGKIDPHKTPLFDIE